MSNSNSVVHVTKLSAAERQLRAAIRMFFAQEDELAIHTVAAAAYSILKDLKTHRGRDEVADYYMTGIFLMTRDYLRGELPARILNDAVMIKAIAGWAEQLPITKDSTFEEFRCFVTPQQARQYWATRNAVSNFLKHADKDPTAYISLDEIENLELLFTAAQAYLTLLPEPPGAEGVALWLYYSVTRDIVDLLPDDLMHVGKSLASLTQHELLQVCAAMCRKFYSAGQCVRFFSAGEVPRHWGQDWRADVLPPTSDE